MAPVGQGALENWSVMNQISKSLAQIAGSLCDEELMKKLEPPVLHEP